jgi:antitoxin component YwqK of YwqJK toxin-antitoxin module
MKTIIKYYSKTNYIKQIYQVIESESGVNIKHGEYCSFYPIRFGGKIKKLCSYKNGKLDGDFIEFYLNEKPSLKCFFKDNELENEYFEYYPNGDLIYEKNYKLGKLNGNYIQYLPNNKKYMKTTFKNGEINGEYILYGNFGEIKDVKLYDNGVLIDDNKINTIDSPLATSSLGASSMRLGSETSFPNRKAKHYVLL